ncbi:hypothetical protein SOCE26_106950 [Sorangium cellulosum]|uniref:Secreted protein n=1 Tax=Sorangium cellulosum TaxID=56 RepID=A0A2L0FC29_SORCE|nr:DUF2330 domain-containing protein [Sorangium cellulosum]AUX49150.1 hypothetical protein SOCE26_106950 [Sorangium cellulosum]
MLLAIRPRMLRRSLALVLPAALLSISAAPGEAFAAGAWLPGAGQASVEQRIAVAAGPERTALWTSLRFHGAGGPVALVVPVPPLAAIDVSSDAWLESLEAATAPRVLPPQGVSPYCPGEEAGASPFHVVGQLAHEATLSPSEVTVLADVEAVALWAASAGLALSPETAAQLAGMQGVRFAAARFDAPGGPAITKALRVVAGGGEPLLPLSLTRAGDDGVLVTAWLLGDGRGALPGAAPVALPAASLTWDARSQSSNYEDFRLDTFAQAGLRGALVEGASHEALSRSVALGGDSIDSVVKAYFARAGAYGDAPGAPGTCAAVAAAALASSLPVAASCPRAEHGVVDGSPDCAESPGQGETDPDLLRCGPIADDLAVALSGLAPSSVWLTRVSLWVAPGQAGTDWPLTFGAGRSVSPVVRAGRIDLLECSLDTGAGGAGASPGSSSGADGAGLGGPSSGDSTSGGSPTVHVPGAYEDDGPDADVGCGCASTADTVVADDTDWEDDDTYDEADAYEGDDCSGDTSEPAPEYEEEYEGDDCSGDTSDPEYEEEYEGDDCSGDTSDPEYEEEYEGDDCSGDTSDPEYEEDAGGDSCSGGSDDSAESEDCSIAGERRSSARKKRGPKLSVMALGVFALLAPIRRASRPRR